jgi:tetratricopeptide (TPR) repeat protein
MIKWMYFLQARILQMFNKNERAIELFHKALEEDRDFALAINCLGHLHASLKQLPEAERYFKEALRIDPNDAVTYFNLGYVLEADRKFEEAISNFQAAVERSQERPGWYGMGLCHAELGRHRQAVKALEAAKIQPLSLSPPRRGLSHPG